MSAISDAIARLHAGIEVAHATTEQLQAARAQVEALREQLRALFDGSGSYDVAFVHDTLGQLWEFVNAAAMGMHISRIALEERAARL